jgi:hypothetical protein
MWDVHRNLDLETMPDGRTVIGFRFPDADSRSRDWWVVAQDGDVDLCDFDPGYPVTVTATSSLHTMVDVWRGELSWRMALRAGDLELDGSTAACRALPHWLKLSPFAHVERPSSGEGWTVRSAAGS